jgi:hypothetical protein
MTVASQLIAEGVLELFPRSVVGYLTYDLPAYDFDVETPRLLGAHFRGNARVIDSTEMADLPSAIGSVGPGPWAGVVLDNYALGPVIAEGRIDATVTVTVVMRLPSHAYGDASGIPRGRIGEVLIARIIADRYGLGWGRVPHPDDMDPDNAPPTIRCIASGILGSTSVTGASALPGEDRTIDRASVQFTTRFQVSRGGLLSLGLE